MLITTSANRWTENLHTSKHPP